MQMSFLAISGVADSPLMTWGEIESTPFRLDGSDTPYVERNHGPSFKVREISFFMSGLLMSNYLSRYILMLIVVFKRFLNQDEERGWV